MDMVATLSIKFLDDNSALDTDESVKLILEEALGDSGTTVRILHDIPEKTVVGKWGDGSDKHKMVGKLGDVIIH
jgi:hypothetical protein